MYSIRMQTHKGNGKNGPKAEIFKDSSCWVDDMDRMYRNDSFKARPRA